MSEKHQLSRDVVPHLFRTEFRRMCSVLCRYYGLQNLDRIEDIVSEVFARALEVWSYQGLPPNPTAWLYRVSRNLAINEFRRESRTDYGAAFEGVDRETERWTERELMDSQLSLFFVCCDPILPETSRIALSLRLLCGFSHEEIASALLCSLSAVEKRIQRAKSLIRESDFRLELPVNSELDSRVEHVCTCLYLMFSEGYYSDCNEAVLREDLCAEAMHLTELLAEHPVGQTAEVDALYALMCFHASRFPARRGPNAELVLYADQDTTLWSRELISRGAAVLRRAARGKQLSVYHLEASIAYWYTQAEDSAQKWSSILYLYDQLLSLKPQPIVELNRLMALARVQGKDAARKVYDALNFPDREKNTYALLVEAELCEEHDLVKRCKLMSLAAECCVQDAVRHSIESRVKSLMDSATNAISAA